MKHKLIFLTTLLSISQFGRAMFPGPNDELEIALKRLTAPQAIKHIVNEYQTEKASAGDVDEMITTVYLNYKYNYDSLRQFFEQASENLSDEQFYTILAIFDRLKGQAVKAALAKDEQASRKTSCFWL